LANDYEGDDSYRQLLELEELESLQEEIEESGFDTETEWDALPGELRERLSSLGVSSMNDLVTHIAYMHAELDEQ
jgi:hypothetical protein